MGTDSDAAFPELSFEELDSINNLPVRLPDYVRDANFALQPREPLKWIIDEIVSESSVNIWVGKFGSKKTWCALSAAVCVALGKPWLEKDTIPGSVLYVDEDMGEIYLSDRVAQTIRGEMGKENIPLKYCSMHGFDLRKVASVNELHTLIAAGEFKLIFVDALVNVSPGADENTVKDVQPIFTNLRRLSDSTGASFVLLHHENRAGQWRGSSAIPGGVDQMLLIKSEESSEFINFETGKHRRGKPVKMAAKASWPTSDQFYLSAIPIKETGRFRSKAEAYVLRYLEEKGPSSLPDIEASADSCAPSSARTAVYALAHRKEIRRTNPDERGSGVSAIYEMAKDEKPE